MSKIHFIEFNQNDVLTTLILDLDKVHLIERKNNVIYIFTPEKVTTLEFETIDAATFVCVSLFDYWKYGNAPPPILPDRFDNN